MPGNETPGNIHNFFEQDNSQGRQSQVGGGGWPILNNNPWVRIQRQNESPLSYNSKDFTAQLSDSEQGNGMQPTQLPFGSNPPQKAELIRNEPSNQQLNLNGYMHATQGLQAEFQGDRIVSEGHSLMQRGFSTFESQKSINGHNSVFTRSIERPEATEAPVSFDFLGGPQQVRSQHPGISQPRPIQPIRVSDMQLWQQQLLYKQLKEMTRQHQLLQLQQGIRQESSFSQLSGVGRQASGDQMPAVLSGTPVNNASNNMWSSEVVGGETKLPSNSPIFLFGNTNWVQRPSLQGIPNEIMFPRGQGQGLQHMVPAPQQPDQSPYGSPVTSIQGSVSYQSQLQGARGSLHNFPAMHESSVNQAGDIPMQSSAFNFYQGDQSVAPEQGYLQDGLSLAEHGTAMHGVSSGATSENSQKVNDASPVQVQETSRLLPEKSREQMGTSQGASNLDPAEEKLLLSTDNDRNQDVSFGVSSDRSMQGYLEGNFMQNNDYFSSFPSLQSGSWSALMQEAVEASSSDTGLNEDWSGLSFQKTDLSSANHSAMLHDNNGKQQAAWDGHNCQITPLTSRPLPLFNDANASSSSQALPNFHQSLSVSCQQTEGLSSDAFHGHIQQSSENQKPFDQNHHKKLVGGTVQSQSQTQLNNSANGNWAGRTCEQRASPTPFSEAEFSPHKMKHSWAHQQKVPLHSPSANKVNGWSAQSLAPTGSNMSKYDNSDKRQKDQGNDLKRTMSMETDHDGNVWKVAGTRMGPSFPSSATGQETVGSDTDGLMVSNKDFHSGNLDAVMTSNNVSLNKQNNQHLLSRHQIEYGKHISVGAHLRNKEEEITSNYQNQLSGISQPWDSSVYDADRRSGESCAHNQENSQQETGLNEGFISSKAQPSENTEGGGSAGESSLLVGNDSQSFVNSSLKSPGQSDRRNMGPRRFQFHPIENLEMSTERMDSKSQTLYSQGPSQSVVPVLKNQEKGYIGHSHFPALNNASDIVKGQLSDLQRNGKAAEERQRRGAFSSHSATPTVDGSFSQFSENKSTGVTSQNMLELLHKVDQSRVGQTVERFGFSEQSASYGRHEADTSDASSSHLQLGESPAFQGFGLKLAPPTQRQSASDHALPSQSSLETASNVNRSNLDLGAGEENQSAPPSSTSVQYLPPRSIPQQEKHVDKSFPSSGDKSKEAIYPNFNGNPFAAAYTLRMNQSPLLQRQQQQQLQWQQQQQQLQWQQQQRFCSASAPAGNDRPGHLYQVGTDSKKSSHPAKKQESRDGSTPDQSSQTSTVGGLPASRLTSPADTSVSAASQFYPGNTIHSQARTASSHLRSSSQDSSVVETRSVGYPSAKSVMSQKGGFSTMLHNVWTSVSSQQRVSGVQPQKIISNVLQPRSSLPSGREALQVPQKPDNQNKRKGENASSESVACSSNPNEPYGGDCSPKDIASEQMPPPDKVDVDSKTGNALQGSGPEPSLKHHSDGRPDVSISSSVRLHQQDLSTGSYAQDSSVDAYKGQVSVPSTVSSNHDAGAYSHSVESLDAQKQNDYSLLQQMQAMKSAESDPSRRAEKRFKGAEFGVDAPHMNWGSGQRYIYGQNTVLRDADVASRNASFSSDVKMLNFSSREMKESSSNTPSQVTGREVPSHDPPPYKQYNLQDHSHMHGKATMGHLIGGSERPQISPQMAPSWFEKYGNHKNGQTLTTYGGFGRSQRNAIAPGQNNVFSKGSESMGQHVFPEQIDDGNLVGGLRQSMSPATILLNQSIPSPSHSPPVTENNMIPVPKKRKSPTSDFLPWHKEVTQGRQRLQSISIMEQKWAWATNRLTEKLEDEFAMIEDGLSMARSRRRLMLTTQLVQQILPPVAARYLSANAATSYESLVYLTAKIVLGDTCSLISSLESDSHMSLDSKNKTFGMVNVSEKEGDNHLSRFVEDFIGRSKNLEDDFLRLDRMTSILDIRFGCQELERHFTMNRFAKFHGRAPYEGGDNSSTSETSPHRSFLQRHVTAHVMPRDLPEEVFCLSL